MLSRQGDAYDGITKEDAVVVDMPDKKIDVNPSASQPTVEKVYSPVTYP